MSFKQIDVKDFSENPFKLIGKDWMLVTAGDGANYNTMTASWGGLGVLWNKTAAFTFVRPQRYTFEFLERNDYYTLSFYPEEFRQALTLCGSKSGRDIDKASVAGLSPIFDEKAPYFSQARIVLVCRKIYGQFLTPESFIDGSIEDCYPEKDYHKMFVSEIVKVLVKEGQ